MKTLPVWQSGQALVEALVLLPVLILSFMAVAWLGQLLFTAQQVGVASRSTAMVAAVGGIVPAQSGSFVLAGPSVDAGDPRLAPLLAEWLGAEARSVSVTAHADVAGVGPWRALRIERRIRVAAGAGNADGDDDLRRRIGAAAISWAQAAERSRSLAHEISDQLMIADGPWQRPALSLDWLSSWVDVVPAEGLARSARATR